MVCAVSCVLGPVDRSMHAITRRPPLGLLLHMCVWWGYALDSQHVHQCAVGVGISSGTGCPIALCILPALASHDALSVNGVGACVCACACVRVCECVSVCACVCVCKHEK
jgi:hypothetical protein